MKNTPILFYLKDKPVASPDIIDDNSATLVLEALKSRLKDSGKSVAEIIAARKLYLRVSVTGLCNLSCDFCHNEGGQSNRHLDLDKSANALSVAANIGFDRVQFTGGEPLLNPKIEKHIEQASGLMSDVGITTNGVILQKKLPALIDASINRIHVSLQPETLTTSKRNSWELPRWLIAVMNTCETNGVTLRINLPVKQTDVIEARQFLRDHRDLHCSINLFTLIREEKSGNVDEYLTLLNMLALEENSMRTMSQPGKIYVREYLRPTGLRCPTCKAANSCVESSRSLRISVDGVWRPCLASRAWDQFDTDFTDYSVALNATLLALDYAPLVLD